MNISKTSTIAKENEKKTTMVLSDLCVSVCVRVQEIAIKKFLYIV